MKDNNEKIVIVPKRAMQIGTNVQTILTIAGVAVTLLNVWLASRIAPLIKDIAVVNAQVEETRSDVNEVKSSLITRNEFVIRSSSVDTSLGRIEGKLDSILIIR